MKISVKKAVISAAAFALVCAAAAGVTLSYNTDTTEPIVNHFTFAVNGLSAMLTEPAWDGIVSYTYDKSGNVTPVYETDHPTKVYGKEKALNMIPGQYAEKDPTITNTCDISEWVAARVTFVYASGADSGKPLSSIDMAYVNDAVEIDFNSSDWTAADDNSAVSPIKTYYYNYLLEKGNSTVPLFRRLHVKETADNAKIARLRDMQGFALWIEGYAVQGTEYNDTDRKWQVLQEAEFINTPDTDHAADISALGIQGAPSDQ